MGYNPIFDVVHLAGKNNAVTQWVKFGLLFLVLGRNLLVEIQIRFLFVVCPLGLVGPLWQKCRRQWLSLLVTWWGLFEWTVSAVTFFSGTHTHTHTHELNGLIPFFSLILTDPN